MLTPAQIQKTSSLHTLSAGFWTWDVPLATPQAYVSFFDIHTAGPGALVSSGFWPHTQQSLCFAAFHAGVTVTYRVAGKNQFGNSCVEDVVCTGNELTETVNCYRQVLEIRVIAKAGTSSAGMNVSVGIGNYDIRLPSYSAAIVPGAIDAIVVDTPFGAEKVFTIDQVHANILVANYLSGKVTAYLNPKLDLYL